MDQKGGNAAERVSPVNVNRAGENKHSLVNQSSSNELLKN
jgi:hypothetical protein